MAADNVRECPVSSVYALGATDTPVTNERTVIVEVEIILLSQDMTVITAVPALRAVTRPVESTEAISGLLLLQRTRCSVALRGRTVGISTADAL